MANKKLNKTKTTKSKKIKVPDHEKNVSFTRIVLLLVNCLGAIIFLTLLVIYLFVGLSQTEGEYSVKQIVSDSDVVQVSLMGDYEDSVVEIQTKYSDDIKVSLSDEADLQTKIDAYTNQKQAAESMVSDLLELRVPTDWKTLHLDLVLAYNQLGMSAQNMLDYLNSEDGSAESEEYLNSFNQSYSKAKQQVEQHLLDYPWVTSIVCLLILKTF